MKNSHMPAMPMFNHNAEPCLVRDKDDKKKEMLQASGLSKREITAKDIDVSEQFKSIDNYVDMAEFLGEEYKRSMSEVDRLALEFRFIAKLKVMAADALLAELEKDEEQTN